MVWRLLIVLLMTLLLGGLNYFVDGSLIAVIFVDSIFLDGVFVDDTFVHSSTVRIIRILFKTMKCV